MNQEKIGKFIAKLRKEKNLTQAQLGEKLNVSDTAVSKWERGKTLPDISILEELSDILEITVSDLLRGEKNTDDITIKAIKYYNKASKYKYAKCFVVLLIVIVIGFLSAFLINNYNRFRVYSIGSTKDEFIVSGYLILNKNKNILIIDNIEYNSKYSGTNYQTILNQIDIILKDDKKILFTLGNNLEYENIFLQEYLSDKYIFLDDYVENNEFILYDDERNFYLEIHYTDNFNIENKINIPLYFKEEISSSKLFY